MTFAAKLVESMVLPIKIVVGNENFRKFRVSIERIRAFSILSIGFQFVSTIGALSFFRVSRDSARATKLMPPAKRHYHLYRDRFKIENSRSDTRMNHARRSNIVPRKLT